MLRHAFKITLYHKFRLILLIYKFIVHTSRFHAYSIANEYEDSFDSFTKSMEVVDSTSQPQGRGRGDGMPSLKLGVGVREDVITLWEELDEARNTLAEIQALLCEIKDPKETPSRVMF